MTDCIFCKIIQGDIQSTILYEDDHIVVFPDIHPKAKIHVLVIPKRHITSLFEVTDADAKLISQMICKLPKLAKQLGAKGFRTLINTGKEGGQHVDHLHIHLLAGNLAEAP